MHQFLIALLLLLPFLGPVSLDGSPGNGQLQGIPKVHMTASTTSMAEHRACQHGDQHCQLDQRAFEAITRLHSLLDDDKDGAVDAAEAEGFAREELAYAADFERAGAINREDSGVSTRELWSLWRASEPYNWTVDEVCTWAEQQVGLPELAVAIRQQGVNGLHLPLLTEPVHHQQTPAAAAILRALSPAKRRRLAIKAMDLVLFGPPKKAHSILKDALLAILLVILSGGGWLVLVQRRFFEDHRLKVVDHLKIAEFSLAELQQKLNSAEKRNERASAEKLRLEEFYKQEICGLKLDRASHHQLLSPSESSSSQAQLNSKQSEEEEHYDEESSLSNRLKHAEQEADRLRILLDQTVKLQRPVGYCGAGGGELQRLLQLTYEMELRYCNVNRAKAEEQLLKASDGLERLKRRQYSLIGLFRNAFDSAEIVDYVEQDIVRAKEFADKVKLDIQERLQRWSRIEQLIGFSIIVPEPEHSREPNIRPYANLWRQKTAAKFKRSATHSSLFAKQPSMSSMHELLLRDGRSSNSNNFPASCFESQHQNMLAKLSAEGCGVASKCSGHGSSAATTTVSFSLPADCSDDRPPPPAAALLSSGSAAAGSQSQPPRMGTHSLAARHHPLASQKLKKIFPQPQQLPELPLESPTAAEPLLEEEEPDEVQPDGAATIEELHRNNGKASSVNGLKHGRHVGGLFRHLLSGLRNRKRIKALKSKTVAIE